MQEKQMKTPPNKEKARFLNVNKKGGITIKDKLTKKQVFAIPKLLKRYYIGQIAKKYGVSWQAVYYHIKKLRKNGVEVITSKQGSVSKIYK